MIPMRTQRVLEAWAELLDKATSCKEEAEKLAAQKDAVPTPAEAKRFEARHEEKLKIAAAAEAAAAEERSRAEAIPRQFRPHTAPVPLRFEASTDERNCRCRSERTEEAAPREANTPW